MFNTLPFKQWVVVYGEDILSLIQKVIGNAHRVFLDCTVCESYCVEL